MPMCRHCAKLGRHFDSFHQLRIELIDNTIFRAPTTRELPDRFSGVGHLTALTFVLTLGNKLRFQRSRDVGCYLGLRPKRSQSGDREPQLGITKAGNG
jgi:transposase